MKTLWALAAALLLSGPALADPALIQAIREGDAALARRLIDSGVDIHAPESDGTTALHWAVYAGEADLVRLLINREAGVNTRNDYGSSPMMEAAAVGDAALLALLLEAGADVESRNPEGQTALMAVSRTGNVEAARLLLEHGADVDAAEAWGGQTALMWASARRHPAMVRLLVEHGADVERRAIARDWERRVTAEPRVKEMHSGGFTALLYAVREDCLGCVQELVEAGADIDRPTPDNVSPLVMALINMRFDVAAYLIEAGADVNQWDIWGRTPLYAAADTNIVPISARGDLPPLQEHSGLDIARMLLERGADPDYRLKLYPPPRNTPYDRAYDSPFLTTGASPLLRAAYGGDLDMMALLLDHGADPHLANRHGFTPMLAMLSSGNTRGRGKDEDKIVRGLDLLLAAGGSLEDRGGEYDFTNSAGFNEKGGNEGETLLHVAVRQNMLKTARFLVEHGADLDARDARGHTPMDYANGTAPLMSAGNFGPLGVLPDMVALLEELRAASG